MGSDHVGWVRCGARSLIGVDLTPPAVDFTRQHLTSIGLDSDVRVADAEALPFADDSFDLVYSWGVLHHSPDTPQAVREVLRVLRPGGIAKIMVYHKHSLTGYMLWARYALLALRPWRSLRSIYAEHLESPGTKAYTRREFAELCGGFSAVSVRIQLNHGDRLSGNVGRRRHSSPLREIARALWPRALIRTLLPNLGLYLLVEARK